MRFIFGERTGNYVFVLNTVSRVKLLGRGLRYSGNVAEFSGDFCKTDVFKEQSLVKRKDEAFKYEFQNSFFPRDDF